MQIELGQLIESGCRSRAELRDRLQFWAARYGFERTAGTNEDFTYTRGSQWQAFYTFDIRKVPTVVTISLLPGDEGSCLCRIKCGSWLQVASPGDEKRLSEQMDLLEACLKGALSGQSKPNDTTIPEPETGLQENRF
jgi:hypothetical protein